MKNILVATDFSDSAQAAAVYAAQLACRSGGRLILLHTLRAEIKEEDEAGDTEEMAQARLDALAHTLHTTYSASVTRLLKPGYAADEIPALAKRIKADVVAVGCYPKGNRVGDITEALVKSACCPVLCIPAGAAFLPEAGLSFLQAILPPSHFLQDLQRLMGRQQELLQTSSEAFLAETSPTLPNTAISPVAAPSATASLSGAALTVVAFDSLAAVQETLQQLQTSPRQPGALLLLPHKV